MNVTDSEWGQLSAGAIIRDTRLPNIQRTETGTRVNGDLHVTGSIIVDGHSSTSLITAVTNAIDSERAWTSCAHCYGNCQSCQNRREICQVCGDIISELAMSVLRDPDELYRRNRQQLETPGLEQRIEEILRI